MTPKARYIAAHPVTAWRFVRACRAPWPALSVAEAEAIVDAEARRMSIQAHPASRGTK